MRKLLVANRGEIAVRVMRAANELGIRTVAMYSHQDRASSHRIKADEAYPIGGPDHPVRPYLDVEAVVGLAVRVGADALHPGYGFLSESAVLAGACAEAGVAFVGPTPRVLRLTGDKANAREVAMSCGIPVLRASRRLEQPEDALEAAAQVGYPMFVKAAAGGGGRGLRLVRREQDLEDAVQTVIREATGAFGDGTVFLEQAMQRPRHIEVQILGDGDGNVVHLFERDCSVQRRHQKVIEVAPAANLDPTLRERLLQAAVRFGATVGYTNAGTVEFLVGESGRFAFIEMNPRIQVEHTVTEETTDVDIVRTQLRITDGASLTELGLDQDSIVSRGVAVQCRITTEDPANGFRPDFGKISAVRDAGGAGVRVDSASVEVGMEVTPYFDPLLIKLTTRGRDLGEAARRAHRAVTEFRVRGVRTNAAFLAAVLKDVDFLAGRTTTAYIDEHPHVLSPAQGGDRTSRLLEFLGDVTVNRPHGLPRTRIEPATKLPEPAAAADARAGSRQRLQQLGPEGFALDLRARSALAVTDTTFRDAHQSLLATRVRTYDLVTAGPVVSNNLSQLLSVEAWGGATYDASLRFLYEDPWDRLRLLREVMPNVCLQMLLRGQNAVGYGSVPERAIRAFVQEATVTGIDIFRVFDALNSVERMQPAIRAVRASGAVAEGTLCYTGNLMDAGETTYTLEYYLRVAEALVAAGAHVLCVKDMAGLLRPPAAERLVSSLRERFEAPVHLHTHDTAGGQLATYLAAIDAGVDAVDGAAAPLAGGSSQPSLAGIVAATDHTERSTGLDLARLNEMEPYWEAVRRLYAPFEAGFMAPTGRVYEHEIPGGQLSNLRQQAIALGLGDRFEEVERLYSLCDEILGGLIKVTPTSKVVGDLALFLVSTGIDPDDVVRHPERHELPTSVVDFFSGDLGVPVNGWPEPFRSRTLRAHGGRASSKIDATSLEELDRATDGAKRRKALNHLFFPAPTAALEDARVQYGDVSILPTRSFLYGLEEGDEIVVDAAEGVRLFVTLEAITDADSGGARTVIVRVNGQIRFITVLDRSAGAEAPRAERADPDIPGQVAAPVTGIVTLDVAAGQPVVAGQRIGTIEAMKMESVIGAPLDGTIDRLALWSGASVEPGDLLVVIAPPKPDGP